MPAGDTGGGGVASMPDFLKKFFPVVYHRTRNPGTEGNYCKYDNQGLQLFTSSLYLAVPLFLSEIAPTRIRGGLNILFQLNVTIGIFFANLVIYGTAKIKGGWGWRLSLGLAGIPALLLTVGALLVVDSPNSLIERGRLEQGKAVLRKISGTDNIEPDVMVTGEMEKRFGGEMELGFRELGTQRLGIWEKEGSIDLPDGNVILEQAKGDNKANGNVELEWAKGETKAIEDS
ncbi:Sugar transport protein 13 [Hibiscus syriacus]|uniref:Sugar transport protein 13 n=1 Tax=Hibiscus syriacus TaxID=106335 RepID=A0A6A2X8G1_HIBSY|nr:Sugar transport protein 13 [Hibiscus syriacus]